MKEQLTIQQENLKHTESQITEFKSIIATQKKHVKEYNTSIEENMSELNLTIKQLKTIDIEIEETAQKNDKLELTLDSEQKKTMSLKASFDASLMEIEQAHTLKINQIEKNIQEAIATREKHADDHEDTIEMLQ